MREMNEIERKFYDAFCKYHNLDGFEDKKMPICTEYSKAAYQYPIDLNILDFYFEVSLPCKDYTNDVGIKIAVEIDGHEYHKTKEQRYHDYVRERKLQIKGIIVIRFTASEVFVNPEQCVIDLDDIVATLKEKQDKLNVFSFYKGMMLSHDTLHHSLKGLHEFIKLKEDELKRE